MKIEDIAAYKYGTDREILGDAVQPGDEWFVDSYDTYTWYRAVARRFAPTRIAEIGVRYGYSAIAMCQGAYWPTGLPVTKFVGIDDEADGVASNHLAFHNIIRSTPLLDCRLYKLNTREHFADIKRAIGECDMIHVDADHSPDGIRRELELAHWVCSGPILIDDCDIPHILDAAQTLARTTGAEFLILPTQHLLGVVHSDR